MFVAPAPITRGQGMAECLGTPVCMRRRRRRQTHHVSDPARELADLRAWLTTALRMAHREPGPEGLTVLTVPSDRELIDEVRRLRALADATEGTEGQVPR
jgi:hypothetical protein